jgi:hypothetical protein
MSRITEYNGGQDENYRRRKLPINAITFDFRTAAAEAMAFPM